MAPNPRARGGKRTLLLIAAVTLAPVIASYAAYYLFPRSPAVNYGTLLPTAPIEGIEGTRPDGAPFRLEDLRGRWPQLAIWLEPGRFLVAQGGVLVVEVTQLKGKGAVQYVGVATGMNSLIRPALYGAHHDIVNLTRFGEPGTEVYNVLDRNLAVAARPAKPLPNQNGAPIRLVVPWKYGFKSIKSIVKISLVEQMP